MNTKNKKQYRDAVFLFLRWLMKLLIVHSFLIIFIGFGINIVIDVFVRHDQSRTPLTYYCFAVFAVLANICFAYARTGPTDDPDSVYLKKVAERFLFSTLGFLIGSILKYGAGYLHTNSAFPSLEAALRPVWEGISGLFFAFSFFFAGLTMHSLLDHLFEKIMLNRHNYYIGDDK